MIQLQGMCFSAEKASVEQISNIMKWVLMCFKGFVDVLIKGHHILPKKPKADTRERHILGRFANWPGSFGCAGYQELDQAQVGPCLSQAKTFQSPAKSDTSSELVISLLDLSQSITRWAKRRCLESQRDNRWDICVLCGWLCVGAVKGQG